MSGIEKQCVFCGQTCVGTPRIRDNEGNYAHKACADKQQAEAQEPEVEKLDLMPDDEPDMAMFLDDLPSESEASETSGIRAACPGCGASISSDNIVCMSCGCNTKTGRGNKTKAIKTKKQKQGPSLGAKAGTMAAAPFLPIIGAVLGGAIGAAIWAAIVYFTGYEIGYVAAGVGALCGFGAVAGAGGSTNEWSGVVAVIVALLSIVTGKTIINSIYIDQLYDIQIAVQAAMDESETWTLEDFTDEDALMNIANDIAWDLEENGEEIEWPNPDIDLYEALGLSDFPQDIINQTNTQWEAMDADEQIKFRQSQIDQANTSTKEYSDMLAEDIEANSSVIDNLDYFDLLWGILALLAAWQVGSGSIDD